MVQIDIEVPRPIVTLFALLVIIAAVLWFSWQPVISQDPVGGSESSVSAEQATEKLRQQREQQQMLTHRVDILRLELQILEQEKDRVPASQVIAKEDALRALLLDQQKAEQELLTSLKELWDAEGDARYASSIVAGTETPMFSWPVVPKEGISAHFHDEAYLARFGMEHDAIDIPTAQGTTVHAAADGVVARVSDKGMGFSSIVLAHAGGYSTMYGHVSAFLVKEGDRVQGGDPIALSGGTPGTAGAGHLTTGPHLHFELVKKGEPIDPLGLLPSE